MSDRHRIMAFSIGIMVLVSALATGLATQVLYRASFEEQRARLSHVVRHRSSIINSLLVSAAAFSGEEEAEEAESRELRRIVEVYRLFGEFGETGELTLARRDSNQITWLVPHRDVSPEKLPEPSTSDELAEPMKRAFKGESGTMIGRDYRGVRVLAAYRPVEEIGGAMVAKIDISEINAPFVRAGLLASGIGIVVVVLGVGLMVRATSPSLARIEALVVDRTKDLSEANEQLESQILERLEIEKALRRMSMVFMDAVVPIVIHDLEGQISDVNAEVERAYGWKREELLGQLVTTLTPSELRSQQRELFARCRGGESVRNVESWRQTKSGERIPVLLSLFVLAAANGVPLAIASIAKDISEQKRLQEQLRAAASEAALAEERERRKLAADLHDGLGQLLVLVSVKLGMLRSAGEAMGIQRRIHEIEELIAESNRQTTSLSFQLSPPILHEVGLVAASQWLAEETAKRFNLHVTVEDDGQIPPLDEGMRVTLFRGLTELLLNVVKHARAKNTHVRLCREDSVVKIEVNDDGIGFDPSGDARGFGLFSIRERLNRLGGGLEVESASGQGTRIVMTGPISSAARETKNA